MTFSLFRLKSFNNLATLLSLRIPVISVTPQGQVRSPFDWISIKKKHVVSTRHRQFITSDKFPFATYGLAACVRGGALCVSLGLTILSVIIFSSGWKYHVNIRWFVVKSNHSFERNASLKRRFINLLHYLSISHL